MTLKKFLKHLLLIALFVALVLFLVFTWLGFYTNHGQELELPEYIDQHIDEAAKDAEDRSFKIIVNDSIHIVGQPGGLIKEQNPKGGSKVKENRKIYVTVTKYNADKIKVGDLPELYGREFNRKQKELAYKSINAVIKSRRYDPGEPDHILEVWYKGQQIIGRSTNRKNVEINIGDTLEFVLSSDGGAEITVPDITCMTLSEARFLLESNKIQLGKIIQNGDINDPEEAYIMSQSPSPGITQKITMGDAINVTISESKPTGC